MKKIILGIFCVAFFSGAARAADGKIHTDTLARSGMSWDGNTLPDYVQGKPEITILRITIPPGMQLPMHHHPVINAGVLLKGELTVTTEDGKTLHLKAGEAIIEVVGTWHSGRNEGASPAEILVFYAGAAATPVTIKRQDH